MPPGYRFEWNETKAKANVRRHGVSFEEASTVYGDPPPSACRQLCGMPAKDALDQYATGHTARKGGNMKTRGDGRAADEDTMRPEYDFIPREPGVTADR